MQQSSKMKLRGLEDTEQQPTIVIGGWSIRTIFADQHWILLQEGQPNYRKMVVSGHQIKSSRQGLL